MFINIQLEIPQLCILKDHHLIIEIIKSCNNLLLKLFSIYGIGASYEGHKGSQTCLIGYLHSVTIKFYYFKNWFSQAILFTKNKNKIIVFFYHCICLCILFSLENKNQIALSLSKHNNLYWTHADVVLVQWISLNTRKSCLLTGRFSVSQFMPLLTHTPREVFKLYKFKQALRFPLVKLLLPSS